MFGGGGGGKVNTLSLRVKKSFNVLRSSLVSMKNERGSNESQFSTMTSANWFAFAVFTCVAGAGDFSLAVVA